MLDEAILSAAHAGLAADLGSGSEVHVGEPSTPLKPNSTTIRVVLEDGGSPLRSGVDGGAVYVGVVEVLMTAYAASPADFRAARQTVTAFFMSFRPDVPNVHTGRWDIDDGGWRIADRGKRRAAAAGFRSRIYSLPRIRERLS